LLVLKVCLLSNKIERFQVKGIIYFYYHLREAMARPLTYKEIAEVLGLSSDRVRQIERKALSKIKAQLLRQGFEADDFIDLRD